MKDILYIFSLTVPNKVMPIGNDPTRLIRMGYNIDSKIARMKLFRHSPSFMNMGFISLKPESPNNR